MAKDYSVSGPNASSAALATAATVIGGTAIRPRVYDIVIGSAATPADQATLWKVQRFTAAGTAGSSPTPEPLDAGDSAAVCTAGITHSAEPTYAGSAFLQVGINQRATFRWVAAPGSEFVSVKTSANGIGVYLVSATAAVIQYASVMFNE